MANEDVKVAGGEPTTPASVAPGTQQPAATVQPSTSYKFGGKDYASVDELGKAYEALQSEHGKWTNDHGKLQKQFEDVQKVAKTWGDWWNGISPLWGDDVEELLRRKLNGASGATRPAARTQAVEVDKTWEGFDLLRPEEQSGRLRDAVLGEVQKGSQAQWQQLTQQLQQALLQKEQYYQNYLSNYLGLMRKAFERKMQDPKFNMDVVMERAAKAMSGEMDPLDLGSQLLTAGELQARVEEAKLSSYAQGKKDAEQELANKKLETVPVNSGGSMVYKRAEKGPLPRQGFGPMRQRAAEELAKKFGPQVLSE